jgi:hypothetical protein
MVSSAPSSLRGWPLFEYGDGAGVPVNKGGGPHGTDLAHTEEPADRQGAEAFIYQVAVMIRRAIKVLATAEAGE